jgi:hypothetical protein
MQVPEGFPQSSSFSSRSAFVVCVTAIAFPFWLFKTSAELQGHGSFLTLLSGWGILACSCSRSAGLSSSFSPYILSFSHGKTCVKCSLQKTYSFSSIHPKAKGVKNNLPGNRRTLSRKITFLCWHGTGSKTTGDY